MSLKKVVHEADTTRETKYTLLLSERFISDARLLAGIILTASVPLVFCYQWDYLEKLPLCEDPINNVILVSWIEIIIFDRIMAFIYQEKPVIPIIVKWLWVNLKDSLSWLWRLLFE